MSEKPARTHPTGVLGDLTISYPDFDPDHKLTASKEAYELGKKWHRTLEESIAEFNQQCGGKKYLVAMDSSQASWNALEYTLKTMDIEKDLITVLRVAEPEALEEYAGRHPWRFLKRKKGKKEAEEKQTKKDEPKPEDKIPWHRNDVKKRLVEANVHNSSHVLIASYKPERGILGFVRRHRYDFLVLGVVGSSWERFKRFMGDGSVSTYCKQYAPRFCTVVVIEHDKLEARSTTQGTGDDAPESTQSKERYGVLSTEASRAGLESSSADLQIDKQEDEETNSKVSDVVRTFRSLFSGARSSKSGERTSQEPLLARDEVDHNESHASTTASTISVESNKT